MTIVTQYFNDNKYFLHIREVFLTEILFFLFQKVYGERYSPLPIKDDYMDIGRGIIATGCTNYGETSTERIVNVSK